MTDLDTRYAGAAKRRPRWLWPSIAAVGISIAVAFCAWVAWSNVAPYQVQVYGYQVVSPTQTTVTLDVYRTKPVALSCQVYAQAEDKHIVGEKTIDVPASDQEKIRVRTSIITQREATTGTVRSCQVVR